MTRCFKKKNDVLSRNIRIKLWNQFLIELSLIECDAGLRISHLRLLRGCHKKRLMKQARHDILQAIGYLLSIPLKLLNVAMKCKYGFVCPAYPFRNKVVILCVMFFYTEPYIPLKEHYNKFGSHPMTFCTSRPNIICLASHGKMLAEAGCKREHSIYYQNVGTGSPLANNLATGGVDRKF